MSLQHPIGCVYIFLTWFVQYDSRYDVQNEVEHNRTQLLGIQFSKWCVRDAVVQFSSNSLLQTELPVLQREDLEGSSPGGSAGSTAGNPPPER